MEANEHDKNKLYFIIFLLLPLITISGKIRIVPQKLIGRL